MTDQPIPCCGRQPEVIWTLAGMMVRCWKCKKNSGTVGSEAISVWNRQNSFHPNINEAIDGPHTAVS